MPLQGTLSGRVLRTQQAEPVSADGSVQVVVPVTDRGDALGVLELALPEAPTRR